jgi:hypothetical protein
MMLFGEPRDFLRLVCLGLIILGAVGLKFASPAEQGPPALAGQIVSPLPSEPLK